MGPDVRAVLAHDPVGLVLTYQCTFADVPPDRKLEVADVVRFVNLRIADRGTAKTLAADRFEVALYGQPQGANLTALKERIGILRTSEFRILADRRRSKDLDIIKLAEATPMTEIEVKKGNKKVGKWVICSADEFGTVENHAPELVVRTTNNVLEALVLIDEWNVTGEYFDSVFKGKDESGQPAVHFRFNDDGARRIEKLTSENLPNPATPEFYRRLGFILNNQLLSAPTIRTTITDQGMISGGKLSAVEVEKLVENLNLSSVPSPPFHLVDEKRVAQ